MLIFITFAVFGSINGFAIYGVDYLNDLIKRDEVPLSYWYKNKFGSNSKVGILLYTLVLYGTSFAVFTLIGCFYFQNGPYHDNHYYGDVVIKLYNFCDLVSN
jgi:hypothetical protein